LRIIWGNLVSVANGESDHLRLPNDDDPDPDYIKLP
jgi:hypothetical protein